MEGTSSLEVGDLSSVVSVTIKEGGKAHTFEVQKDVQQRETNQFVTCGLHKQMKTILAKRVYSFVKC